MEKWMCLGSIGVAVIMLLVFALDMATGMPFSNGKAVGDSPFMLVDIGGIVGGVLLAYLGWNAYRDLR
jgi:uncharacterized integral membrane protein